MRRNYYLWYLLAIPFVAGAVLFGYTIGNHFVEDHLIDNGYTDIELSYVVFNPKAFHLSCSGKHPTVRHYKAKKNGKAVTGIVCWNTFVGADNWDD